MGVDVMRRVHETAAQEKCVSGCYKALKLHAAYSSKVRGSFLRGSPPQFAITKLKKDFWR